MEQKIKRSPRSASKNDAMANGALALHLQWLTGSPQVTPPTTTTVVLLKSKGAWTGLNLDRQPKYLAQPTYFTQPTPLTQPTYFSSQRVSHQ